MFQTVPEKNKFNRTVSEAFNLLKKQAQLQGVTLVY